MSRTIPSVTISLLRIPKVGDAALLARITDLDRSKVNRAAATIGLMQSDFLRIAIVRVAEAVIKVQEDEDFGANIDLSVEE